MADAFSTTVLRSLVGDEEDRYGFDVALYDRGKGRRRGGQPGTHLGVRAATRMAKRPGAPERHCWYDRDAKNQGQINALNRMRWMREAWDVISAVASRSLSPPGQRWWWWWWSDMRRMFGLRRVPSWKSRDQLRRSLPECLGQTPTPMKLKVHSPSKLYSSKPAMT